MVDVRRQGASAAAVVRGFATQRGDIDVAGVVFNNVGGSRHAEILRETMASGLPHIPVLGYLPHDHAFALPERHLGLVQATEHPRLEAFLGVAAKGIATYVDTDSLIALARPELRKSSAPPISSISTQRAASASVSLGASPEAC